MTEPTATLVPVPAAPPDDALAGLTDDARARVESAAADTLAPATRRGYRAQWDRWVAWAEAQAVSPLPATAADVAAYLTERATTGKMSTVRNSASAIAAAHRSAGHDAPTGDSLVRAVLRGIARQHASEPSAAPHQAAALDLESVVRLMTLAGERQPYGRGIETPARAEARGRQDRAIVALLFCAGLRRSEAAELRWQDIGPTSVPGQLRVHVRRSKTNQTGQHDDYRLLVNGFAAALAELRSAVVPEDDTARVVPLSDRQVNRRLQALAALAGIEGISAHSGRRGMASELVRRGASTTAIQAAGGWKDPQMVARYASAVAVEDGAIARYF